MSRAVAVLGCRLRGRALSPELRGRMRVGVEAFRERDADALVCTGGRRTMDDPRTEADAMREYALEGELSETDVVVEERALDTVGNAYFTRRLRDESLPDVEEVLVVTSCYHRERARFCFEACFGPTADVRAPDCFETESSPDDVPGLERVHDLFRGVAPGDVDSIRERLLDAHDSYGAADLAPTA